MKRIWWLAVLLLGTSISLFAQVGSFGGRHGFGFAGPGFGGHGAVNPFAVAPSAFGAGSSFGFRQFPCCSAFGAGFGFAFGPHNRPHGFRHHRFNPLGFGAFGGYGYPIYMPYYGYVPLYDDYSDQGQGQAAAATQAYIRQNGAPQVEQSYAPPPTRDQPVAAPPAAPPEPQDPTVLVFRDGHKLEVRNYAIVGNTLFNLDATGNRRIQLADLDIPATIKVNDDRGVDFRLPGQ